MTSAFVTNIAFPKSLEEVMFYLYEVGCFDVEKVLVEKHTEWTPQKIVVLVKTSTSCFQRLQSIQSDA